jgi:hypothetical protein
MQAAWVDHGGAGSEQDDDGKPDSQVIPNLDHRQRCFLDEHPSGDYWFAALNGPVLLNVA